MDEQSRLTLARYKKLMLLAAGAVLFACAIGLVGGWLLYENHEGGKILGAYLLWPGMVAVIAVTIPIRVVRKRWFPTKESLVAAAQLMAAQSKSNAGIPAEQAE